MNGSAPAAHQTACCRDWTVGDAPACCCRHPCVVFVAGNLAEADAGAGNPSAGMGHTETDEEEEEEASGDRQEPGSFV